MNGKTLRTALLVGAVLASIPFVSFAQTRPSTHTTSVVAPGHVATMTSIKASAKIVSIDRAKRTLLVKLAGGKIEEIEAGPEVRNFEQLKAGDTIHVEYVQALSLELKKAGTSKATDGEHQAMVRANPGAKPGAAAGRVVTVLADVKSVNRKTHNVTLRGPEGWLVDLHVKDAAQLANIKVGDHVEATYAEALALTVEEA